MVCLAQALSKAIALHASSPWGREALQPALCLNLQSQNPHAHKYPQRYLPPPHPPISAQSWPLASAAVPTCQGWRLASVLPSLHYWAQPSAPGLVGPHALCKESGVSHGYVLSPQFPIYLQLYCRPPQGPDC